MKFLLLSLLLSLLISLPSISFAEWRSATTDLKNDCVVVSSATEEAPIDFYHAECKSFGGYGLAIEGGDLRYGPQLTYKEQTIDLKRPYQFHDLAAESIEWQYVIEVDNEGVGKLDWRGMIYQLSVAQYDEESDQDKVIFYSVRLKGLESCVVGMSESESVARALIQKTESECL